ncbi:hypothetical protein C8Q73DRAFT_792780 [Cubamyces lactineus]|nr:hypothetical protein C8Q73DRAFT_792780 [Cubamyces lactineus]
MSAHSLQEIPALSELAAFHRSQSLPLLPSLATSPLDAPPGGQNGLIPIASNHNLQNTLQIQSQCQNTPGAAILTPHISSFDHQTLPSAPMPITIKHAKYEFVYHAGSVGDPNGLTHPLGLPTGPAASPHNILDHRQPQLRPAVFVKKSRDDYPKVPFWRKQDWRREAKPVQKPGQVTLRGSTRAAQGINVTMRYISDADGNIIDGYTASVMRRSFRIFCVWLWQEKRAPQYGHGDEEWTLGSRNDDWWSEEIAVDNYSQWRKKHIAYLAKRDCKKTGNAHKAASAAEKEQSGYSETSEDNLSAHDPRADEERAVQDVSAFFDGPLHTISPNAEADTAMPTSQIGSSTSKSDTSDPSPLSHNNKTRSPSAEEPKGADHHNPKANPFANMWDDKRLDKYLRRNGCDNLVCNGRNNLERNSRNNLERNDRDDYSFSGRNSR